MCFSVEELYKTKKDALVATKTPLIATRDIVVYKVLQKEGKRFFSPNMRKLYFLKSSMVEKRFSFDIYRNDSLGLLWRIDISKGLHSYRYKKDVQPVFYAGLRLSGAQYIMVKCFIPKGTPYFKNNVEYVSLKLRVTDTVFYI